MLPNVKAVLAVPGVTAIVGNSIYAFDDKPQDVDGAYITWFSPGDSPYEHLSGPPVSDLTSIQIDCYGLDQLTVDELAGAVRRALDAARVSNRLIINTREPDTKLYRMGFEADFILNR